MLQYVTHIALGANFPDNRLQEVVAVQRYFYNQTFSFACTYLLFATKMRVLTFSYR